MIIYSSISEYYIYPSTNLIEEQRSYEEDHRSHGSHRSRPHHRKPHYNEISSSSGSEGSSPWVSSKSSRSRSREKERHSSSKHEYRERSKRQGNNNTHHHISHPHHHAAPSHRNRKHIVVESKSKHITKPSREPSNSLVVSNLADDVKYADIETLFHELSTDLGVSEPHDIRFLMPLHTAYIIYPSVNDAKRVFQRTRARVELKGKVGEMEYISTGLNTEGEDVSSLFTQEQEYLQTYNNSGEFLDQKGQMDPRGKQTHGTHNQTLTTVHEDWICEDCECKNFAKRKFCFRCKKEKSNNAKIVPVVKHKSIFGPGEAPPTTSLMVRGTVIPQCTEGELLEIFSAFAQVKDIRTIKDRYTSEFRDFAFVEFFNLEDTNYVLNKCKQEPLKINGIPVFVTYSRLKRPGDSHEEEDLSTSYNPYLGLYNTDYDSIGVDQLPLGLNQLNAMYQGIDPSNYYSGGGVGSNFPLPSNPPLRKELTQQEKVAFEMKMWEREQKKLEKLNKELGMIDVNLVGREGASTSFENVLENAPANQKITLFICRLCKRKFRSGNNLARHLDSSELHKGNLENEGLGD